MPSKYIKLISITIFTIFNISCMSQAKDPTKVSLVSYTEKYKEYVPENDYLKYEIGNNTILLDSSDENRIFIVKDKKILAFVGEEYINLYRNEISYPFEENVIVNYAFKDSFLKYKSKNIIYHDIGLNGIDIELEKKPFADNLINLGTDEFDEASNATISRAIIKGKQCESLVGTSACCLTSTGNYEAYVFNFEKGWMGDFNNEKLTEHCNSGDLNKTRNELTEAIYGNL